MHARFSQPRTSSKGVRTSQPRTSSTTLLEGGSPGYLLWGCLTLATAPLLQASTPILLPSPLSFIWQADLTWQQGTCPLSSHRIRAACCTSSRVTKPLSGCCFCCLPVACLPETPGMSSVDVHSAACMPRRCPGARCLGAPVKHAPGRPNPWLEHGSFLLCGLGCAWWLWCTAMGVCVACMHAVPLARIYATPADALHGDRDNAALAAMPNDDTCTLVIGMSRWTWRRTLDVASCQGRPEQHGARRLGAGPDRSGFISGIAPRSYDCLGRLGVGGAFCAIVWG